MEWNINMDMLFEFFTPTSVFVKKTINLTTYLVPLYENDYEKTNILLLVDILLRA